MNAALAAHRCARAKVRLPEIARKLGAVGRLTAPARTGKTRPLRRLANNHGGIMWFVLL